MSPLRLNGSTSGYAELAASATAGDVILTLPSTAGTLDRTNRAGNILQVVSAELGSATSTASTTFQDTGLSASITPSSASNKIMCFFQGMGGQSTSGRSAFYRLLRDSTVIKTADNLQSGTSNSVMPLVLETLDSPATISSVTYKIQIATDGVGTISVSGTYKATLTLMEVAA